MLDALLNNGSAVVALGKQLVVRSHAGGQKSGTGRSAPLGADAEFESVRVSY